MASTKTNSEGDAAAFLASVAPLSKRAEAGALDALFRRATGWEPVLWPGSILGYGRYRYRYESGREGESLATGFSPRAAQHSLYVMAGLEAYGDILSRLGRHRTGKACLYVRRLEDIDLGVLEELVRAGLKDLAGKWPVRP